MRSSRPAGPVCASVLASSHRLSLLDDDFGQRTNELRGLTASRCITTRWPPEELGHRAGRSTTIEGLFVMHGQRADGSLRNAQSAVRTSRSIARDSFTLPTCTSFAARCNPDDDCTRPITYYRNAAIKASLRKLPIKSARNLT